MYTLGILAVSSSVILAAILRKISGNEGLMLVRYAGRFCSASASNDERARRTAVGAERGFEIGN